MGNQSSDAKRARAGEQDSPAALGAAQASPETPWVLQGDVGTPKHCQRAMTRLMKDTYELAERTEDVYLSKEEPWQKHREEIGRTVVLPCATQDFALCGL